MSSVGSAPRRLDHAVLPVGHLSEARARLGLLGFTVAPDANHPFGTRNCCVYFEDGTFLEPLAVGQRETCEAEALAGNAFVARDQAYRFRNGEEGFSALAFGSDDADADDEAFRKAGIGGGAPLAFSRVFETPSGGHDEAAFRLAFASDLRAPDAFFFTCQRIQVPHIDRRELEVHDNAVVGLAEVVLCEANPTDFQYMLQTVVRRRDIEAHSFGLTLEAGGASVSALTPDGLEGFFGQSLDLAGRGLRLAGLVFRSSDLSHVATLLETNGVDFSRHGKRLVVPPAKGQGAFFAFEDFA